MSYSIGADLNSNTGTEEHGTEAIRSELDRLDLEIAKAIAGAKITHYLVNGIEPKKFNGKIIGTSDNYVAQSFGKTAIIHHKNNLERVPDKGEVLTIIYGGIWKARVSCKTQDKGVGSIGAGGINI